MKKYSLTKGLGKGILSLLSTVAVVIAYTQFNDIPLADLIDLAANKGKSVVGALTIGGALTMLINYAKVKFSSQQSN